MDALENKIPPPLVAVVFALVMAAIAAVTPEIEIGSAVRGWAAALVLAVGLLFVVAGIVSFRRAKTTVNPLRPDTASFLVTSGIYRFTRNPMYVGFALVLLAWAVFLSSAWALLGVVGFVLYLNRFQIIPEERALTTLFGTGYTEYQAAVRRWL